MIRKAYVMKLKPGYEEEYKVRHDNIWPELALLIKKNGIEDYSIYLDEDTLLLFSTLLIPDDFSMDSIPVSEVQKKWWDYMADIMDVNPDNSPVTRELKEVFYME